MMNATRSEHMQWCKQRALEYLPSDPQGAIASMLSDLTKHDETREHPGMLLAGMMMFAGQLTTATEVKRFIEGFN